MDLNYLLGYDKFAILKHRVANSSNPYMISIGSKTHTDKDGDHFADRDGHPISDVVSWASYRQIIKENL